MAIETPIRELKSILKDTIPLGIRETFKLTSIAGDVTDSDRTLAYCLFDDRIEITFIKVLTPVPPNMLMFKEVLYPTARPGQRVREISIGDKRDELTYKDLQVEFAKSYGATRFIDGRELEMYNNWVELRNLGEELVDMNLLRNIHIYFEFDGSLWKLWE